MKAHVKDVSVLRAISLADVAMYMRHSGWVNVGSYTGKASVWEYKDQEVLLPVDSRFADYHLRMSEVLMALEKKEQRSQLQILNDLCLSGFDVVRFRNLSGDSASGTLPVLDGVQFGVGAKDALFSAACSSVDSKSWYPTRKPKEADEFIKKVRLGQTEQGSYVFKLLTPVPPKLAGEQLDLLETELSDPFERVVTKRLLKATTSLVDAANESLSTGSVDSFVSRVRDGVSANLCDSIVNMSSWTGHSGIEISIAWSRNRPAPTSMASAVYVDSNIVPVVREASRIFKETQPESGYDLIGVIIKCERNDPGQVGKVTVLDIASGSPRKIVLELKEIEYNSALEAHKNGITVRCHGDVVRSGKYFSLVNNSRLEFLED